MTAAPADCLAMPTQAEVLGACQGDRDAQHLVAVLADGMAPRDALHDAWQAVAATGDAARARAFARGLQKRLEAAR
ncbi:hypothetical protein BurJ1DRAFT_2560 [Burkholderiales bacterium JOSHI_001]|nr:hypothetical protein BurJ1DRAFT_2560 [Burkholderiales bacterium JOSHI_001]